MTTWSSTCRRLALAGFVGTLLAATAVRADIDVYLYTTGDLAAVSVAAGATLPLYTYLSTTPASGVGGLFYTVQCPDTTWSLAARDYVSYGWYEGDPSFDQSTPVPATTTFALAVTDDLFATTPGTADFSFSTSRNPAGTTITAGVIETFALVVPSTPGVYDLSFGVLDAFNGIGTVLGGETGHGFRVTVEAPVPEPSGLLLLALAGAGALGWRRPRRD
jgi:hypothetical protein